MNDTHDTNDGALPEVFLGRQPILDCAQQLVAYELLFRPSLRNDANPLGDQALATATVVTNAFTQLSLGDALGACRGYVNVDENFRVYSYYFVGSVFVNYDKFFKRRDGK